MSHTSTITWRAATDELPDDDSTVLLWISVECVGEIWTGYRDGDRWRYVTSDLVESPVTHWADMPEGPTP